MVGQCCSHTHARSALGVPAASHQCSCSGWHVRQPPSFLLSVVFPWRRVSGWPSSPPPVVPVPQVAWSSPPCCAAPCRDFCSSSCRGHSLLRYSRGTFANTSRCVAPTFSFTLSLPSLGRAELTSSTSCLCTGRLLPCLVLSPLLLILLSHTSSLL